MSDEAEPTAEVEAPRRKAIMIATPMYGGMCTGHYVRGLLNTVATLRDAGVQVYWTQLSNESLIPRARNELTRIFLATDIDYLMFIDADIGFDGAAVATLLEADVDVACGIYPKKEINWVSVAAAAARGEEADTLRDHSGAFVFNLPDTNSAATDDKGLIEIRHGGTGFMLIKRGVFDALTPHVPTFRAGYKPGDTEDTFPLVHEFFATSIDHNGTLLSEDYHFCDLHRKHGGKVHANPFIKLEHVGTYVFGGDLLKSTGTATS